MPFRDVVSSITDFDRHNDNSFVCGHGKKPKYMKSGIVHPKHPYRHWLLNFTEKN